MLLLLFKSPKLKHIHPGIYQLYLGNLCFTLQPSVQENILKITLYNVILYQFKEQLLFFLKKISLHAKDGGVSTVSGVVICLHLLDLLIQLS